MRQPRNKCSAPVPLRTQGCCTAWNTGTEPPPAFDREVYRRRNTVEGCFNALKHFRGIATRYDKTAASYEAAVGLAPFLLWARSV
ncbi:hypothetical protein [Streptomyces sp. LN785]|uniref:hypothetical protein n=1 Tax=Streptomyces sp. LN785 TaxID=3112983 RepID=UPI003719E6E1